MPVVKVLGHVCLVVGGVITVRAENPGGRQHHRREVAVKGSLSLRGCLGRRPWAVDKGGEGGDFGLGDPTVCAVPAL